MEYNISNLDETFCNVEHYIEMGDNYLSVGKNKLAQDMYDIAAEIDPDNASSYLGTGLIALEEGEFDQAKAAFNLTLKLDPENSKAHAALASMAYMACDFSAAFDHYLKSLEYDSDNLVALLGLFQTSSQMGTFAKVIYYLEMFLEMHPNDLSVSFCLASLYVKEARLIDARNILLSMLNLKPDDKNVKELLEEVDNMLAQELCRVA